MGQATDEMATYIARVEFPGAEGVPGPLYVTVEVTADLAGDVAAGPLRGHLEGKARGQAADRVADRERDEGRLPGLDSPEGIRAHVDRVGRLRAAASVAIRGPLPGVGYQLVPPDRAWAWAGAGAGEEARSGAG
jgi:hypothetical protein